LHCHGDAACYNFSLSNLAACTRAYGSVTDPLAQASPTPALRQVKKGSRGRTNVDIDTDRVRQEVQGIARAFVMDTVKRVSQRSPGRT
jgi:hypothetical protein